MGIIPLMQAENQEISLQILFFCLQYQNSCFVVFYLWLHKLNNDFLFLYSHRGTPTCPSSLPPGTYDNTCLPCYLGQRSQNRENYNKGSDDILLSIRDGTFFVIQKLEFVFWTLNFQKIFGLCYLQKQVHIRKRFFINLSIFVVSFSPHVNVKRGVIF